MFARMLTAAGLALVLCQAPAAAGQSNLGAGAKAAISACLDVNEYLPAEAIEVVQDGLGDWLVWIEDRDTDLWMCNASEDGAVYANVMLEGDLLEGNGFDLINYSETGGRGLRLGPAATAEFLCSAIGNTIENMEIVETVDDGLGDYLVWLENDAEDLWVCNASADAKLYVFEPVDYPLNDFTPVDYRFA